MKTKSTLILIVILTLRLSGQITTCDMLEKASVAFCKNNYDSTLVYLLKFRENFPNYGFKNEINRMIGHLYFLNSDFENSKKELTKIIETKITGKEYNNFISECPTNYDSTNFKCMRIVFPEPYDKLQRLACIDLCDISIKEKEYDKALGYLKFIEKNYVWENNCGRSYENEQQEMKNRYQIIDFYKKEERKDKRKKK